MSLPFPIRRRKLTADEAARTLAEAGLMQAEEFYALSDELRQVAFTLARVTNAAVMARCRQELEALTRSGGTMGDFLEWLEDSGQVWERWYAEVVWRNAVMQGYGRARWIQVNRQHIREAFPCLLYDAIADERTTELCQGLDGRWWERAEFPGSLWPPNHHQCRSVVRPVTRDRAQESPDKQAAGIPGESPADGWGGDPSTSWQEAAERRASILERFIGAP